ncbi:MAG: hypothetical protein DBY14_01710 [Escherichia coli]|nr:MAG: hypothetical protein DBY14_01710 [Escherichia coli]
MTKQEKATAYFKSGYNCSQSVVCAFSDLIDMSEKSAATLASGFGGGMGRLREVCGAVSGMIMVANILYGENCESDAKAKKEHYERIQYLANRFEEENGSIICRELLGLDIKGADSPVPSARTTEYYKKRPCAELAGIAAKIMDEYIEQNPIK